MSTENPRFTPPEKQTERKSLGQVVRQRRNFCGLSQENLAAQTGLSQGYLSQIENDEVENLNFATHIRIAKVLGLSFHLREEPTDKDVFIMPQATDLQEILSRFPSDQQEVLTTYIKLAFPQDNLKKLNYIDSPLILSGPELGYIIQRVRNNRGWSQGSLARKTSHSQGHISDLETGKVETPSLALLNQIAEALKVDVGKLLEITDVEVPNEIASVDQFLRDENVPQDVKEAKLKSLMGFLEVINDPLFQENFVILSRNQQSISN